MNVYFEEINENKYLTLVPTNQSKEIIKKYEEQKQPSKGVFSKTCSENMQQIYRRIPMPKCGFNEITSNFIEIALRHGCSPVNLLHIFRTPFTKNTSVRLLLEELWSKIRDLIRSITKNSDGSDEKYIKIKFVSDDNLPLNKTIEIHTVTIVVRAIFYENKKYYSQVF